MRIPAIPKSASWITTNDPEEATRRQHLALGLPAISRALRGQGPLVYSGAVAYRDGCAISWTTLDAVETQQGSVPHPQVQMIIEGQVNYRTGRRVLIGREGDIVYVPRGFELSLERGPGRFCNWLVPAPAFDGALARACGRDADELFAPLCRLEANDAERAALEAGLQIYAAGFDEPAGPDGSFLCSWLAAALLRSTPITRLTPLALARLRRMNGWLDAHLGESITLSDLARAAICGTRALQRLVAVRYGTNPLAYVRLRRLSVARGMLIGQRTRRVAEIAHDVGIHHLGRFGLEYSAMFGESPSATRRRISTAGSQTRRGQSI